MLNRFRNQIDNPLLIGGWALLILLAGIALNAQVALIILIGLLPVTMLGFSALVTSQNSANRPGAAANDDSAQSDSATVMINTPSAPHELEHIASSLQAVTIQQRGDIAEQTQIAKRVVQLADDLNKYSANARRESVKWSASNSQMRATLNNGRESLTTVLLALTETLANNEQSIVALTELARYIRRIGQLIASVNEIATQSNFLALNTAIEAARAETTVVNGASLITAGGSLAVVASSASFATVADEMRLLADQSRGAVGQLRAALIETQGALTRAAAGSEATVGPLEQTNLSAQQLETVFSKLSEALDRSVSAAQQIAATTDQQSSTLETLAQTAESIEPLAERMRSEWQLMDVVARDLTHLAGSK
jgi:methyl-accepting chemotaxis protein